MKPIPKQTNVRRGRIASAPYNFVPLPETVIPALTLPDHDQYYPARQTGYFKVKLTTKSPLYIRGMLTYSEYEYGETGRYVDGGQLPDEGNPLFHRLVKNKPDSFHTHDRQQPVIPGSSLRGMLRSLFEIVTYSKVKPVTDTHKIFYRAVADQRADPRSQPYKKIIGPNAKHIRAGYLIKKDSGWWVQPAKMTTEIDVDVKKEAFFKVREGSSATIRLPGFLPLSHDDYVPAYYDVKYDIGLVTYLNKRDEEKRSQGAAKVASEDSQLPYTGVLVCAGNMKETNKRGKTLRKNVVLVPERAAADPIKINDQAVQDYLDTLTPFQKQSPPFDEKEGVLKNGRPIFYIYKEEDGEIFFFGHTPNFRIPVWREQDKRTVTPGDFVPKRLNRPNEIDYAEAVFGFVRTQEEIKRVARSKRQFGKQGSKKKAYASRVFVSRAVLDKGQTDVLADVITPAILASPQPTTFQHYLTQSSDKLPKLHHYGSSSQKTTIRGHKLYWHQGNLPVERMKPLPDSPGTDERGNVNEDSTQHTRIQPVKEGVTFTFYIHFDSLSPEELGALCWVLHPLGDESRTYHHRLGMAKPLGMGSVALDATLYLVNKREYYGRLFNDTGWEHGFVEDKPTGTALSSRADLEELVRPFEEQVLKHLHLAGAVQHLYQLRRMAVLLKMLEWPGQTAELPPTNHNRVKANGTPNTRYMHIQLPGTKENEFKDRPVLPDPSQFGTLTGDLEPPPFSVGRQCTGKIIDINGDNDVFLEFSDSTWTEYVERVEMDLVGEIKSADIPEGQVYQIGNKARCKVITVDWRVEDGEIILYCKPIPKKQGG